MTILPDHRIRRAINSGRIGVEPVNLDEQLQPASLDIRLGNEFREYTGSESIIKRDTSVSDEMVMTDVADDEKIILFPDDFYLATTKEEFDISSRFLARLTGRSSIGRLGIAVHQTAGLFDPGFTGQGVLELSNVSDKPIELQPGMRIAQMTFEKLTSQPEEPYNEEDNRYQNQQGAVPSRVNEDVN